MNGLFSNLTSIYHRKVTEVGMLWHLFIRNLVLKVLVKLSCGIW